MVRGAMLLAQCLRLRSTAEALQKCASNARYFAALPSAPTSAAAGAAQPSLQATELLDAGNWKNFDATKFDADTLEALVELVCTRSELFEAHLARGDSESAKSLQALIARLDDHRKLSLAQKLAAVTSPRSTPALLAWTAVTIKQQLGALLAQGADAQQQPWFSDVLQLAKNAAARGAVQTQDAPGGDIALMRAYLAQPASLTWQELLELPSLESLLSSACAEHVSLEPALALLGLDLHAREQHAAVQALAATLAQLTQAAHAQLASGEAGDAAVQAAVTLRVGRYVSGALGTGAVADAPLAHLVLRLLGVQRPLDAAAAQLQQLTAELLAGAAEQVAALHARKATPERVAASADADVAAALTAAAAAQPEGAAAKLRDLLQAARKALLLAADPLVMATAGEADVASLSQAEITAAAQATQRREARGSALSTALLLGRDRGVPDLATVLGLPADDRAALAWCLLRGGAGSGAAEEAAGKLMEALAGHAAAAARERSDEAGAREELVRALALERDMAELDLLGPGASALPSPAVPELPGGAALPSDEELAAARGSLPAEQLLLFDLLVGSEDAGEREVLAAFEALLSGFEKQEDPQEVQVPQELKEWINAVRPEFARLSPPVLALMRRFLRLHVRSGREEAAEAAGRMRALLGLVQEQLARTERMASSSQASTSLSAPISPYWSSLQGPDKREGGLKLPYREQGDPSGLGEVDLEAVRVALGEAAAAEFIEYCKIEQLNASVPVPDYAPITSPYEMLADQQRAMDVEKLIKMSHEPSLHLNFRAPPRPWREPAQSGSEEEFLDAMRGGLDGVLQGLGMRPLRDVEWSVYKDYALSEFGEARAAHEAAVREAGGSAFFNSKAEEVYLQQLLSAGVPPASPISEQASRYLEVLLRNKSWSFAQKKHAVQRLIELSAHFSAQPPSSERGSPFAPLFASGPGAAELIPKLSRLAGPGRPAAGDKQQQQGFVPGAPGPSPRGANEAGSYAMQPPALGVPAYEQPSLERVHSGKAVLPKAAAKKA